MLSVRLCTSLGTVSQCALKTRFSIANTPQKYNILYRNFASDVKQTWTRRRRTLGEIASQPTKGTPFAVGQAAIAGASIFGIGALCYYGLGMSSKAGIIEQAALWPEYVRNRVKTTYQYFGSSIVLTAASAVACFRSPMMMNLMSRSPILVFAGSLAALIASSTVCRNIPYEPGFGGKQISWMVHSAIVGAVIAPICIFGGPLLLRAAWLTGGVVGGLSAVAVCAPSDKFLYMGGPLAAGMGVVLASTIGSLFLPPTSMLGAGLFSVYLYGGLLLFSGFLLYDTQKIIRAAEVYPQYSLTPFDPITASMSIYMDTVNIFIRIVQILALQGGSRKK